MPIRPMKSNFPLWSKSKKSSNVRKCERLMKSFYKSPISSLHVLLSKNFYSCHNLQCTKYLQFTMFTILLWLTIFSLWTIFTNVESSKSLAVINWLALCYYRNTPNEERNTRFLMSACFVLNLTSSQKIHQQVKDFERESWLTITSDLKVPK